MTRREGLLPDLVWLVPVVLAALATTVTARDLGLVLPLVLLAAVPWGLLAAGRVLLSWLFGVLGIGPVLGILVLDGLNASVFLATTALSLLTARTDRAWQLAALTMVGIGLPFASAVSPAPFDPGSFYFAIGDLFAVAVGLLLGHTRRLDARLRDADARLVTVTAQEERARLARDVHDLVAHSLTVVVLQVGGARRVLRTDVDRAEEALAQAEAVCRESLDGMREVVGLLRTGDDAPGGDIDVVGLLATYRGAGLTIDAHVDDEVGRSPLLVRGTLYRVVREALANAARYHVPGSPVTVTAVVDRRTVTATITNRAARVPERGGGHGLTGLREQVGALGGTLRSGPDGDDWLVECRLPQDATTRTGLPR